MPDNHQNVQDPSRDTLPETDEMVAFHPSPFQRVLAMLGVIALILLFIALLYLIRKMA